MWSCAKKHRKLESNAKRYEVMKEPALLNCQPTIVDTSNIIHVITGASGFSGMEWWTGMDWNGGLEWNGGMEQYFGNFNWWPPLYKDHLFIKTVLL